MGRKRSRSRSRQPSAPPARRRRRRRSSARTGRSRSEPKKTPVTGKIAPAATRRTTDLPPSKPNKETRVPCKMRDDATGRKRSRSRSREPPAAQLVGGAGSCGRRKDGPSELKFVSISAKRTGTLRGQALALRRPPVVQRPATPPPPSEKRAAFRASPSPEPAEEEHAAATAATSRAEEERRRDGGRGDREKALYLVLQEQSHGHGAVSVYYAVHRVGLARSPHGVSVSGEELEEPPVARFKAAPGMSFLEAGSSGKIVGIIGKGTGAVDAESVVIDAGTWEVSAGPPPPSAECTLVVVSGRIFAADVLAEEHPRCEVLRSGTAGRWWLPLPRPPFRGRIVKLAAYPPCRGILASTDKGETYLLDRRRRRGRGRSVAWVALHGSALLPFDERAVYAKGHGFWFEVSPADGRLRAHGLDVVPGAGAGAPRLVHAAHRVSDPIPVIAPSTPSARGERTRTEKLLYLGRGNFCAAQAAGAERGGARAGGGCRVTVTVFRVVDSGMPATDAERRRRLRERGMNARWIAELERAIAEEAAASGRRRRKLCRVNMWSRTYNVRGGAGVHGPSLAGVVWM